MRTLLVFLVACACPAIALGDDADTETESVGPAAATGEAVDPAPVASPRPDLTGEWRVFLPAGYEYPVTLKAERDGHLAFDPRYLNFGGRYRIEDGRIVHERPDGEPLGETYVWRIRTPYMLEMDGTQYDGAVLFRPHLLPVREPKPGEEPVGRTPVPLPRKSAAGAASVGPPQLSIEELAARVTGEGGNPLRVYGHQVRFTGTILAVIDGIDGGRVPRVRIEDWPRESDLYGTAWVHNVPRDRTGREGDRVEVDGLIVEHGYGTLFLWSYSWRVVED